MSNVCPSCSTKIPGWWVRDYCDVCGYDLPQSPQQAEIERLRDALVEIDNITGFDWSTMPEAGRAKAHEITRKIVVHTLNSNTEKGSTI